MSNLERTNQRCYICDFSKQVGEDGLTEGLDSKYETSSSLYQNSLTKELQTKGGRYVFIHPNDGRPICNHCSKSSDITLAFMNSEIDNKVTWADSNAKLFERALYLGEAKARPITPEERLQIDAIRMAKGYILTPQEEESRRLRYNRSVEAFWSPVAVDPRCPGTSTWPMQTAAGDPSEAI